LTFCRVLAEGISRSLRTANGGMDKILLAPLRLGVEFRLPYCLAGVFGMRVDFTPPTPCQQGRRQNLR
jgi:hypothetical protein